MRIIKLDPAEYAGKEFTVYYKTSGYYDIYAVPSGFQIKYRSFGGNSREIFSRCVFQ